jgi:predicted transcriptional regulator
MVRPQGWQLPSDKFSISLPTELVAELEALARLDGVSRSSAIQEASARYVADRKSLEWDQLRRASVDAALTGFDEIASDWGEDPQQGADYLAELRADAEQSNGSEVEADE